MDSSLEPGTAPQLAEDLKRQARALGFELAGICRATEPGRLTAFHAWLDAGYAGEMHYFAGRRQAYEHPRHVLAGAQSVLMLGMNYRTGEPQTTAAGEGRVARYAWGQDYHDLIHDRLASLRQWFETRLPGARARGVVDTAPLLERELAQVAGLGWIGKNTLLLNRELGSWFFLAALLTDVELPADEPFAHDHCGTCRACLDACPTGAFVDAYVLDSRRCLSYLTIEHRGPVPDDLRTEVGDWLFGCDICQDVCPWNRRTPVAATSELQPVDQQTSLPLGELFSWSDEQFRIRFAGTPLWRAKRRGLLRNAALVLANRPDSATVGALSLGLADREPLVRSTAAWALGQLAGADAIAALDASLALETDAEVCEAITRAKAAANQTAA